VPEGLPMMVTVSLALNMMKMARENCLVRKLVASETIGSATVICTDKTGTLTQNQMTPVWGVLGTAEFSSAESLEDLPKNPNWDRLVQGICINSSADLHVETASDGTRTVNGIGNPTECAFLKFLDRFGVTYAPVRLQAQIHEVLGHNSQRKMSAVKVLEDGKPRVFLKGAPERILLRCSTLLNDGTVQPLTPEVRAQLEKLVADASARGLRILAFADGILPENEASLGILIEDEPFKEFTLTGILGIADPLRAEVPDAVAHCQKAGIVVKMVTGDALPTARAIARDAGIFSGSESELVMTSEEFNAIPDEELPEKAKALRVLARSTPSDKLRLVKALHEDGEVVAMTGDGTNDAPALKFADVGLSMGKTGTEVAKEASDIVLMSDDFTNIVTGVRWGRTLYQNIQRFLQFQLSVNAAALLCAVIGPCVGVPLPLTVTQLLWINIIMDTFAAIAYSTQPPRANVLDQPPIKRHANIITPEMLLNIAIVSVYQTSILFASLFGGWFVTKGADGAFDVQGLESLTIFFTTLVMFQFWHKFNCRSLSGHESAFCDLFKCRGFLAIVFLITVTQIVLVQIPAVGVFFRTVPLTLIQWLEIAALTSTVLVVGWIARKLSVLVS
nr:calcium-translocating P-type ATPase, PMCA-type [Thermoguttaceae bacterium]